MKCLDTHFTLKRLKRVLKRVFKRVFLQFWSSVVWSRRRSNEKWMSLVVEGPKRETFAQRGMATGLYVGQRLLSRNLQWDRGRKWPPRAFFVQFPSFDSFNAGLYRCMNIDSYWRMVWWPRFLLFILKKGVIEYWPFPQTARCWWTPWVWYFGSLMALR